jgi:hypothetical protein
MRYLIVVALAATIQTAQSQSVTGSWYGKADVIAGGFNNNYLTELILKQKGDDIEGIFGYYFKDSYESFFIRGTYNKSTREVIIKNLPMLFYRATTRNGIECPMNFQGSLMVSQVSSTLRGTFYSDEKYKYTCPEMRVNLFMDANENQDSVLQNTVAGKKFWRPQEEDFIVANPANNKTTTLTADVTTTNANPGTAGTDIRLLDKFSKRRNVFAQDLTVISDSIRVSFYDNGDIDGDSISVFLNNQPVLVNQELTARALNIYFTLDSTKDVNEVSMFAENLGKYPPNTALMVISDGVNRYEVYMSSTLSQNAAVRLRRKKH